MTRTTITITIEATDEAMVRDARLTIMEEVGQVESIGKRVAETFDETFSVKVTHTTEHVAIPSHAAFLLSILSE